ncbi:MAG: Obg family GTPase CgtA [Parcubacteria bacterium C7867-007]|nr:MAG: Obg family GTPase CgtA [Parcubacteria bacterium C7867-007]
MAFIDEMHIHARAGHGGNGVVRWLHIKGNEKAGPAGGDGGRGGDIILRAVRDLGVLARYRYAKKFNAENGAPGGSNDKHGRDGENIVILVPVGTVAKNCTTQQLHEFFEDGEEQIIFKGGIGGLGNPHFKSSTNQNPKESTPGKPGQAGDIHITLKLIADVGLVGFPNAGKSSLLNSLTRAQSKVGSYPFTTLDPHLGEFYGYMIADIPGLIEGSSSGKGLGSKFLRHIERTKIIGHLVSAEQEDVVESYHSIRKELESFSGNLEGKEELVVLSKADLLTPEELSEKMKLLAKASGKTVIPLSVIDDTLLKAFSDTLAQRLEALEKQ